MTLRFSCRRVTDNRLLSLDEVKVVWHAAQEALAMTREEMLQRRRWVAAEMC